MRKNWKKKVAIVTSIVLALVSIGGICIFNTKIKKESKADELKAILNSGVLPIQYEITENTVSPRITTENVKVAIYDDGINRRHGVDLAGIPTKKIKPSKGGIMHNKFCVIDNQIVITGSYNWSSNAEFKNEENISILRDNKTASDYSVKYRDLTRLQN